MQAPKPNHSHLVTGTADVLECLRARKPRVRCITNATAENVTADVLLAMGRCLQPIMAGDPIAELAGAGDSDPTRTFGFGQGERGNASRGR